MKRKKIIILTLSILILFSLSAFSETKKLKQIGRFTFARVKGEIPTSEVMKVLIDRYVGDIKYGFDLAGYGDLYLPFIEQVREASFEEKEIAVGEKWMWMLFRSRGKIKVVEDIEWAGKNVLPVFSFIVKKGYKNYEFVMPKPCGNISLLRIWESIPDAICDIRVSPVKANSNDPISVDMSGTKHAKSMEVEVYNPQGTKVATKTLTPDSPRFQTKFSEPGEYVFKAKAVNLKDKASSNLCEAKTYINSPPVCKLVTSCLPCENYVGRPITIDASQSTDSDGKIARADFEIRDEGGDIIDTFTASGSPFTWQKTFEKPGVYKITVIVADDFGAVSQPCSLDLEVTQKRLFFLIEAGPLFSRGSHAGYTTTRLGLLYEIVPDKFDFIFVGGGSLKLKSEPWKSFFLAEALFNIHAGQAFFGAGAGFSSKVKEGRESDFELIANLGFNIFKTWTSRGAVFVEGRGPVGKDRSFSKHHKFMLGFRFLF